MKHKDHYQFENKGDSLSAREMKERLEILAAEVEEGQVVVGDHVVEIDDRPYFLKSRVRVKDGHLQYQLFFETDLAGSERKERASGESREPDKSGTSGRKGAKQVKKELKSLWKDVVPGIDKGMAPDQETMQQVLKLCGDYEEWVQDDWKNEWDACKLKLEECFRAAAEGDSDEAGRLMGDVKSLIKSCHDKYK